MAMYQTNEVHEHIPEVVRNALFNMPSLDLLATKISSIPDRGFHRMLRKYTKNKVIYPTDESLKKSVYLSVKEITKKWSVPMQNWGQIAGQFLIFFDDRLSDKYAS